MPRAKITATGMAVPERVLTNDDLAEIVDTSDEWIRTRTGMVQRHVTTDAEAASDIAYVAAKRALEDGGYDPKDIDAIVLGTITPDYIFPSTACVLQNRLGANGCAAFDVSAACTGFIYALTTANGLIAAETFKRILVVGVDVLTKTVDWKARETAVLFGDGAGAAVVEPSNDKGVMGSVLHADGKLVELLYQPAGGSRTPMSHEAIEAGGQYIIVKGREIYRHATQCMPEAVLEVVEKCGKTLEDVDLVVPHQANMRIIDAVAKRLKLPIEKFYINIEKYANTSAATVPMATHEALKDGSIKEGDLVVMVSFGAGLTWGATLVQF